MGTTKGRAAFQPLGEAMVHLGTQVLGEWPRTPLSAIDTRESILHELTETHGVTIDGSRVLTILGPRGLLAFTELGERVRLRDLQRLHQHLQAALNTVWTLGALDGLDVPSAADLELD
jgi:hypothetical protein